MNAPERPTLTFPPPGANLPEKLDAILHNQNVLSQQLTDIYEQTPRGLWERQQEEAKNDPNAGWDAA